MAVAVYLVGVAAFVVFAYRSALSRTLKETDERLVMAAVTLKHLLAKDFHDRAVGPRSISFEEEMRNRQVLNAFIVETGFAWLYTLVEEEGRFHFAAPTVTDEEAREKASWYYHPYGDIPAAFREAYEKGTTIFVSYDDQWGSFRSVAVAETTPGGRRYLACADASADHLAALARRDAGRTALTGLYFLLLALPLLLLSRSQRTSLQAALEKLSEHKEDLEEEVSRRTAELERTQGALRERAIRDPLTHLFNRSYILERLREEIGHAKNQGSPLCLMMIDLDHFKAVNDSKGHLAGDRVLRTVSVILRQTVRHSDIVGRFGGDEFLVVLPNTDLSGGRTVAEKLRRRLRESPVGQGDQAIGFSIGVACRCSDLHATGLLAQADRLLYEAKRQGGDCIIAEATA